MEALPVAYLNGVFMPVESARISPLDRGFLFGDAIYEVIPVYGNTPVLMNPHLNRLENGLRALEIRNPHSHEDWCAIVTRLIEDNGGGTLAIYLQVSRGADTGRDHVFPDGVEPTVFGMATTLPEFDPEQAAIKAITLEDNRWGRCDIKSTSLLANVLLRQAARTAGAADPVLLRNGYVTEGGSSSVIIVEQGVLIRRPNGPDILPGTTTDLVLQLAAGAGVAHREEAISEQRLRQADEIWMTGAGRGISAVTELDGQPVGDGTPGPVFRRVAQLYRDHTRR